MQLNDIALNIRWQSFGTCIASTDHQSNAWSPFLIFSLILPSFSILDILAVSSFCSFSPLGMAPPEVVSCFSWSPLIFLTSLDILWYYLPNCFPKWSVFCLVCLCVRACVLPLSGLSYACTFPVDTWHFQTFPTQHVSQHGISHMFCFPEFQSRSWTNLCCVWKRISQQTKWLKLG